MTWFDFWLSLIVLVAWTAGSIFGIWLYNFLWFRKNK